MDGFPSGQRGQTVNLLSLTSVVRIHLHPFLLLLQRTLAYIAGWSSLEARRAHNPKVTGSNPVPATSAQIAQLVEQRTENPRVAGSIPALGTNKLMWISHMGFFLVIRLMLHANSISVPIQKERCNRTLCCIAPFYFRNLFHFLTNGGQAIQGSIQGFILLCKMESDVVVYRFLEEGRSRNSTDAYFGSHILTEFQIVVISEL